MLLGKIPLHTSSPSKRYSSGSYSQSLEFVSYPRIHLKRGIKNKLPFKEVLVPGQSVCYRNKLVFSSSSDDLHPTSQVLMPIFNLISWSRFIFFNFIFNEVTLRTFPLKELKLSVPLSIALKIKSNAGTSPSEKER